jgi:S-adenosylmethionine:tRNA ribosyltransferase-isomerase
VRTDLFDYALPEELIARWPSPRRDDARLLVVEAEEIRHRHIADWPDLVPPESLVVTNDTRVIRARLLGARRQTGGRVEILLLRQLDGERTDRTGTRQVWSALGHANRPLRSGARVDAGPLAVEVLDTGSDGVLTVSLSAEDGVQEAIRRHGRVPIPPYLRRESAECDEERYQTVYAARDGSVAAPTAGLHLTPTLLDRLGARGVRLANVTLHIGLGTFRPVVVDDLDDHPMHTERYEVGEKLAGEIRAARERKAQVVAVGTTVVRALESARDPMRLGCVCPGTRDTRLLIQPGYAFGVVDALLTNFHQPRSTLLALVAAFVGRERALRAYRAATELKYRFLSYGDAMWIPERWA